MKRCVILWAMSFLCMAMPVKAENEDPYIQLIDGFYYYIRFSGNDMHQEFPKNHMYIERSDTLFFVLEKFDFTEKILIFREVTFKFSSYEKA